MIDIVYLRKVIFEHTPTAFRIFFLTLITVSLQAQSGKLTGVVMDAKTKTALPYASVYLNNTTIGTATNDRGEFVLENLPLETDEIVFSFVGYTAQQLKLPITENTKPITVFLKPDEHVLSEVEIKSTRDKLWEKQLKKFTSVFLGNKPGCKILNPWVLDFSEQNKILMASASQPLEIENRWLGYKIKYQLRSFVSSIQAYTILGNAHFEELRSVNVKDLNQWNENREEVFVGSLRNLIKSIIDLRINQQGFSLYQEKVPGKPWTNIFSYELQNHLTPIDTSKLKVEIISPGKYQIYFPNKLEVHHNYYTSDYRFYNDVSYPVSWVEVRGGKIIANKDGVIINYQDVVLSGAMSNSRIASLLPLDYRIKRSKPVLPSKKTLKVQEEKIYLHIDKSRYYADETIWFRAYLNYRFPNSIDSLSKVLYVDLFGENRKIKQQLTLAINQGRAEGAFHLPENMQPGSYFIRAYTNWQRNFGANEFFYKPISVEARGAQLNFEPPAIVNNNLIQIETDHSTYQKRSNVSVTINADSVSLLEWESINFSLAVVPENLIHRNKDASILEGIKLNEPPQLPNQFKFSIEHGVSIQGVYQNNKGKSKKAKLSILAPTFDKVYSLQTNDRGEFQLEDLHFFDSLTFGYQPQYGKVILKKNDIPELTENLQILSPSKLLNPNISSVPNDLNSVLLKEIQITGKKTEQAGAVEKQYGEDRYIKGESMLRYQNLASAIEAMVPGYRLQNDVNHYYLTTTRRGEPMVFIENVQVVGETAGDKLMSMDPSIVDHIEIKGLSNSAGTLQGGSGAIYIYLKKSRPEIKSISVFKAKGYDSTPQFKSVNCDSLTSEYDSRLTLFWNPNMTIVATKPIHLSFCTSDNAGKYRIILEGITNRGKAVHAEAVLKVD